MVKKEIIERSPLRKLEEATHGGVGKGKLGVIASRRGIGKTACLVHIATDKLMRGKHVIHVSYSSRVDHIITWYEDIFKEISKKRNLEDAMEVHDELIKNRVIMNFNQKGFSVDHVIESVKAMMKNGQMDTDAVIVDGFDFTQATKEDVKAFSFFAKDSDIEIWFSDSYTDKETYTDKNGMPKNLTDVIDQIEVVLTLQNKDGKMILKLVKDHDKVVSEDLSIKLDEKSLLLSEA
ncbi:MAG: hypothetical protein PF447_07090 [Spirochaetaceae bacterium]|jgi:KaiC/GvpD/RAD55 family RecA-like ATPase|nr:hypothetical protein [Spirochaetaceae bacterium]